MARVVCTGIAVLDHVFSMDCVPEPGVKHHATRRQDAVGGIAANGARAVARLGGEAVLVARIGDDVPGRAVRTELERDRIDLRGLHAVPGARTSLSAVIVDPSGDRTLINDTDPRVVQGLEGLRMELFEGADAVLIDPWWLDAARVAVRTAREINAIGVLDFDTAHAAGGAMDLPELASHVVFGRQGLAGFTGTDDVATGLRHARERTPAWLAVTSGAEGVYWLDGDTVRHLPGFVIDAVDTLGAGDIFHAAFALALAEGQSEPVALRFANAAAALKCTRFGGGAGAPYRDEVEAFMRERA